MPIADEDSGLQDVLDRRARGAHARARTRTRARSCFVSSSLVPQLLMSLQVCSDLGFQQFAHWSLIDSNNPEVGVRCAPHPLLSPCITFTLSCSIEYGFGPQYSQEIRQSVAGTQHYRACAADVPLACRFSTTSTATAARAQATPKFPRAPRCPSFRCPRSTLSASSSGDRPSSSRNLNNLLLVCMPCVLGFRFSFSGIRLTAAPTNAPDGSTHSCFSISSQSSVPAPATHAHTHLVLPLTPCSLPWGRAFI